MRVSRLYLDTPLTLNSKIVLPAESAHYVRTVLRLKKFQALTVFNGHGGEFLGKLLEVNKTQVVVDVLSYNDIDVESPLSIKFGLGISRGDRMDWAIQKAVELGVAHITPLLTERCVIKLSAEKRQQRLQHWQKIIQHAAEQSGRTKLAEMPEAMQLNDWINNQYGLKIFLDPRAQQTIAQCRLPDSQITLLSGPEGGFSDQEREMAVSAGFIPIRLGRRILRTETAALAAISAIQTLWGDFQS